MNEISLYIFMMTTLLLLSMLFSQLNQPLSMGLTILFQTLVISFTTGMVMKSVWFSYILFLIFLGAILVLFLYVVSLAPNEMFPLSPSFMAFMLITTMMSFPLLFFDQTMLPIKMLVETSFMSNDQLTPSTEMIISLLYSTSSMSLTIFIILYLLINLIVIVKITNTFFGPLRTY